MLMANGSGQPACSITKNIVADFGAVSDGLTDVTAAFVGAGSFQDWAVNTYQPSNPGATICLTIPSGQYFFGTFTGIPIFQGITSLVVNANGATTSNALNLTATGSSTDVVSFPSVPTSIKSGFPVIDLTTPSAIPSNTTVSSTTTSTVTLSASVTVSNGDVLSFGGGGYFLGTAVLVDANTNSAALNAVSVGATSVTLQTPSQASLFTPNTYALLTGVDMEGFGYPPNPYFWEYVFVVSANTTTGIVTFQSPTQFAYKATWPQYNFGDAFHISQGGPATLYALPATWNVAQWYNGLTVYQYAGGTLVNISGRSITCNSCTFTNWGPDLSQQQTFTCNNCNLANISRLETDKLWQNATFNGGTIEGFFIQSASAIGTLTLNGTHITSGSISGASAVTNLSNVTLDTGWQPGAAAYGQTAVSSCSNSVISGNVSIGGYVDSNIASATMSGGVITVPLTLEHPVPWAVPGAEAFFPNGTEFGIPFTVVDITGDATNTYIQTSLAGGFPGGSGLGVRISMAQKINFVGCTGAPQVVDLSQLGARNARPFTYSNRIYTCTGNVATIQTANPGVPVIDINNVPTNEPVMTRAIQSMTIAVSPADTSGNATVNFHAMTQFDNYPIMSSSAVVTSWGAVINLKAAGTRTYNGTTSSWSGAQTGDTLPTIANPSYMTGPMQPFLGTNISGDAANTCPVVTITIQTSRLEPANDNGAYVGGMAA